jgi:molybdopterin/thiamine biosynthesis adenylyltransferase
VTGPPFVLLTSEAASRIEGWGSWGRLGIQTDPTEGLVVIHGVGRKDSGLIDTGRSFRREHYLATAVTTEGAGAWYSVDPQLHDFHDHLLRRPGLSLQTAKLQALVTNGWRMPPVDQAMPLLAWSRDDDGSSRWSMWWVSRSDAVPGPIEVLTDVSPLSDLAGLWPVDQLSTVRAVVVGLGSIGSVVAESLADYAVGRLDLVDPDRLLGHNLVRHRLGRQDLGRLKVNAIAERLTERHGDLEVRRWPRDVILDADVMRPLFAQADLIVGATDGVSSRRVVNHLARRARVPAVFACVLEHGALGEVVRIRPETGCLMCYRQTLEASGSLNPEPDLDRGYGTGTTHLPMTAVGGDLSTVGCLAAKIAVATVLEGRGHWEQRLPGDALTIGLQPVPGRAAPFDIEEAAGMRWNTIGPSRADCFTCAGR